MGRPSTARIVGRVSTNANRREQLRRQKEAAARAQRTRRIVGVFAGLIAVALVGILVYALISGSNTRPTTVAAAPGGTPSPTTQLAAQVTPEGTNAAKDALVVAQGREGTPTVTLYLDYQCPNCRTFEQQFGAMLADGAKAGDWTLQYRTMTFMDYNLQNTASTRAAIAASCAADTGHYEAYHEQVYAHQALKEVRGGEGYTDEQLRVALPAAVGITGDALTSFQACYDGRATQDFVAKVDAAAHAAGVKGTPTLTVNDKPVDFKQVDPFTPDGLRTYLLANA